MKKVAYLILTLSLILNIFLSVELYKSTQANPASEIQIETLKNELNRLSKENNLLKKQVEVLNETLQLTKKSLEYYRKKYNTVNVSTHGNVLGSKTVNLVAVSMEPAGFFEYKYVGHVLQAEIEIINGEGRILTNIQPKVGIDLQNSLEAAKEVAEKVTGRKFSNIDIVVSISSNEKIEVVDGPSAGAILTAAIIATVENKEMRKDVFCTGTIEKDGSIGQVGGVTEKAVAAAERGGKLFLVPEGQGKIRKLVPHETEIIPGLKIIKYKVVTVNLQDYLKEKGYNIEVVEVSNILDVINLVFAK